MYFSGVIDEFAVYNETLSDARLQYHYSVRMVRDLESGLHSDLQRADLPEKLAGTLYKVSLRASRQRT